MAPARRAAKGLPGRRSAGPRRGLHVRRHSKFLYLVNRL